MSEITFDMLHGLIGSIVEISPKFNRAYENGKFFDERELLEAVTDATLIPGQMRFRGRLGIIYHGVNPEPIYGLKSASIYIDGKDTGNVVDFESIENADALRAAHLIVLAEPTPTPAAPTPDES